MPLSTNPAARQAQLANLRPGAGAAGEGNSRRLVHGGTSELLLRDVEAEVRELMDALGESAPVRDAGGGVPLADVTAIEVAARALKRYRALASWLDLHGRLDDKGRVRPAAELELKAERALATALDALAMTPAARSRIGVDLARARDVLAEVMAERGAEL